DDRAGADYGRGMNAGRVFDLGMDFRNRARGGGAGLWRADHSALGGVFEIGGNQQAAGGGRFGALERSRAGYEGKIVGAGVFEGRDFAQHSLAVAFKGSLQKGG